MAAGDCLMHELSLCQDMLRLVEEQLGQAQPLASARVTVGPLSGVDPEALRFAFPEAARALGFGTPVLTVVETKAKVQCLACDTAYEVAEMYETCPRCGALQRTVLSGEEFTLDEVELAGEEDG